MVHQTESSHAARFGPCHATVSPNSRSMPVAKLCVFPYMCIYMYANKTLNILIGSTEVMTRASECKHVNSDPWRRNKKN